MLPASFALPREVMPTLNGAENAELVLPLPLGPKAAEFRGREDYNIIGTLKPGVSGRRRRRPRWTPSPRGCAAITPTSIRRTAA